MHKPLYCESSFDKQQSTPTQLRFNDNQRHLCKRMSQSHRALEHKLSQPIHWLFICHCTQVQSFILILTNAQWQRRFASIHRGDDHWWRQSTPLTIIQIELHNGNNNYGNNNNKCRWQDLVHHWSTILYPVEGQQQQQQHMLWQQCCELHNGNDNNLFTIGKTATTTTSVKDEALVLRVKHRCNTLLRKHQHRPYSTYTTLYAYKHTSYSIKHRCNNQLATSNKDGFRAKSTVKHRWQQSFQRQTLTMLWVMINCFIVVCVHRISNTNIHMTINQY